MQNSVAALALLTTLLATSACGGRERGERLLYELERMTFVAPGRCLLLGRPAELRGVDLSATLRVVEPLLVDRFEATRDDWRHHMGHAPRPNGLSDPLAETGAGQARGAWPAFANLEEAREFASRRKMRLLTAGEWVYVAAGPTFQRYPWGSTPRTSVANTLELGLLRPLPVGTFESGLSASGCYDLFGNVMEWVEGSLPPAAAVEWTDGRGASAMGGSYSTAIQDVFGAGASRSPTPIGFHSLPLAPGGRSVDLGVRCAVEAERFLLERLVEIDVTVDARRRLEEVGRRWGRSALPLLDRLAAQHPRRAAFDALAAGARQ